MKNKTIAGKVARLQKKFVRNRVGADERTCSAPWRTFYFLKKTKKKLVALLSSRRVWKQVARRGLSLFMALSLSVTSLCVGFGTQEVKKIQAIAGVDDYLVYYFFFVMSVGLGAISGGSSVSDTFVTRDQAGITDTPSAENYVRSFTSHPNFSKMFSFKDAQAQLDFEVRLAAFYLTSSYILNNALIKELLDNFGKVEGTSAINLDDVFENLPSNVIKFPAGNNNDDDDSSPTPEPNENKNVFPEEALPLVFQGIIFRAIYYLSKNSSVEEYNNKFNSESDSELAEVCDYTYNWWCNQAWCNNSLSSFVGIHSEYLLSETAKNDTAWMDVYSKYYNDLYFGFGYRPLNTSSYSNLLSNAKIYPLVYYDVNGIPVFKIVECPSLVLSDSYYTKFCSIMNDSPFGSDFSVYDSHKGISISDINLVDNYLNIDNLIEFIVNRNSISPDVAVVNMPNVIDCGTQENAEKFETLIQSGKYTYEELLRCMEDGWKGLPTSSWKGIDDNGETAKKVIESEEGKKYKTSGTGKDENGNKKKQTGINVDSVVNGLAGQADSSKVGAREFLGDETKGSPVTYPEPGTFPSPGTNPGTETDPDTETDPGTNPGTNPGTDPGTNPGTNPGTDPGTNPGTNPGTDPGTNPGTNPGAETAGSNKPDDIDPDEVKTPGLQLKFPFCIPWDVVNLVTVLSKTKKCPEFNIPFKLKNKYINIDYTIKIDFSDYDEVIAVLRWFLLFSWIFFLVMITRKMLGQS